MNAAIEMESASGWGINNDYARLRDVLLGKPEYYRWVDAGPIIRRTLLNQERTGVRFDLQVAMAQHSEMVSIYEGEGVTCHYLDSDPVLHRNFFARDSSAMSPWGALICHMQLKCRRADYVTAIRFYQENRIPIWRYASAGHFEGGDFVILEPGTVLIGFCGERSEQEGSEQVAGFVREEGWEAMVAPISREFVHMDGLVVPLAPEAAGGLPRRDGGVAGALAARARLRVRRCGLCGSQEPRGQPGRVGRRQGALHEGEHEAQREAARAGLHRLRPRHVDVHAWRRWGALPVAGVAPGRGVKISGYPVDEFESQAVARAINGRVEDCDGEFNLTAKGSCPTKETSAGTPKHRASSA